MSLIDFLISVFIWFSPWADADQPFSDMGITGTIKLYGLHLYVYLGEYLAFASRGGL